MLKSIIVLQLLIGAISSFTLSIIILVRSGLDPGALAEKYPMKDYCSTTVMAILLYSIIVALYAIFNPIGTLLLIVSGSLFVIQALYYPVCFFVDRHKLIDHPYFLAICVVISAPLAGGLSSAVLLAIGLLLITFREENFDVMYVKRYKKWAEQKALRHASRYWSVLMKYPLNIRKIMLVIIVVEDIARPRNFRAFERMYARVCSKRLISTGIMQVLYYGPLTDIESVVRGCEIVSLANAGCKDFSGENLLQIARTYNGPDTGEEYLKMMYYFMDAADRAVAYHSSRQYDRMGTF